MYKGRYVSVRGDGAMDGGMPFSHENSLCCMMEREYPGISLANESRVPAYLSGP